MAALVALALFPLLLQCGLSLTRRHGGSSLSGSLKPHSRHKVEDGRDTNVVFVSGLQYFKLGEHAIYRTTVREIGLQYVKLDRYRICGMTYVP